MTGNQTTKLNIDFDQIENLEPIERKFSIVNFRQSALAKDVFENGVINLSHSRKLALDAQGERFFITSPHGEVELQVRITPEGPLLSFHQSHIEISNEGNLNIKCKDLRVQTEGKMQFECGAEFHQTVAGNYSVDVRDDAGFNAQSLQMKAELGELSLIANDDIALNGLRVLLNVPTQEELEKKKTDLRNFQDFLSLPFVRDNEPKRLLQSGPKERRDWKKK